jgi:hypothetical protein
MEELHERKMSKNPRKNAVTSFLIAAALILAIAPPIFNNGWTRIPSAAASNDVTVDIAGTIDSVENPGAFRNAVHVKDTITGSYTYNPNAIDSSPNDPESGTYTFTTAPYGMNLQINGLTFQTNPENLDFGITVVNGQPGVYVDEIFIGSTGAEHNLPVPGVGNITEMGLYFIDRTGNAITSDSLATAPMDLSTWKETILFVDGPNGSYFGAHLTSAKVRTVSTPPVPSDCGYINSIFDQAKDLYENTNRLNYVSVEYDLATNQRSGVVSYSESTFAGGHLEYQPALSLKGQTLFSASFTTMPTDAANDFVFNDRRWSPSNETGLITNSYPFSPYPMENVPNPERIALTISPNTGGGDSYNVTVKSLTYGTNMNFEAHCMAGILYGVATPIGPSAPDALWTISLHDIRAVQNPA